MTARTPFNKTHVKFTYGRGKSGEGLLSRPKDRATVRSKTLEDGDKNPINDMYSVVLYWTEFPMS